MSITHWNHDRCWLQGTSRPSPLTEPPSTPNCPTLAAVIACWAGCWSCWMWTTPTSIILSSKDGEHVKLDNFGESNSQWWGRRMAMFLPLPNRLEGVKLIKARHILGRLKHTTQDLGGICTSSYPRPAWPWVSTSSESTGSAEVLRFCDPKIVTATCFQNEHPCLRPQRKQWNETRPSHLNAMKYRSSCCKRQVQMKKAHWQKSEVQIYVQH